MRISREHWLLWASWGVLVVALVYFFDLNKGGDRGGTATLLLGDVEYQLEIADTPSERAEGLSGRESLCSTCGMAFVFPKKTMAVFWMQDMRFDLDFLWISECKVVQKNENVSFQSKDLIKAPEPVDTVLELPSGAAQDIGVGEKLEVRYSL